MKDYAKIWRDGNNAGEGYSVGAPDDSIDGLDELGELVKPSFDNEGFAVYRTVGGYETIVADANGPWAVDA